MNKERKASKEKIDENRFIKDVRKIVKEEIEDAIKIKEKSYLSVGSFEIGGFLSYTSKGIESDENDNNTIMKIFPMVNYFIHDNIGIMIKGEAGLNLTQFANRPDRPGSGSSRAQGSPATSRHRRIPRGRGSSSSP